MILEDRCATFPSPINNGRHFSDTG